jgi:flagellar hook protein FlgE
MQRRRRSRRSTSRSGHLQPLDVDDDLRLARRRAHRDRVLHPHSDTNEWEQRLFVDGTAVGTPQTAAVLEHRRADTPAGGQIAFPPYTPATGAAPLTLTYDFDTTTQYGSSFAVNSVVQDGYTTGRLIGIDIDETGVVQARFTNGRSQPLGQVALAQFSNPNGLQQLGDTNWGETFTSGQALRGRPATPASALSSPARSSRRTSTSPSSSST